MPELNKLFQEALDEIRACEDPKARAMQMADLWEWFQQVARPAISELRVELVRDLHRNHGITYRDIAELIRVDQATVQRIGAARRSP